MGLLLALVIGLIVLIATQYFLTDIGVGVSIFIAGFVAGLLADGILKGLLAGLVLSVVGILITVYFFGGIPGFGTNFSDIFAALITLAGMILVGLAAIASFAGAALKRYKFSK